MAKQNDKPPIPPQLSVNLGKLLQILSMISDGPTRLKLLGTIYADIFIIYDLVETNYPSITRMRISTLIKKAKHELDEAPENYAMTLQPFDGHVSIGPFLRNLQEAELALISAATLGNMASYDSGYFDALATLRFKQGTEGDIGLDASTAERDIKKFFYPDRK